MNITDKTAMLAKAPKGQLPNLENWLLEPKYDGWRILIVVEEKGLVRYFGRSGAEYSGHTPKLDEILSTLPRGTVLDGEMVHPKGWRFVQTVLGSEDRVSEDLELVVFDVLQLGFTLGVQNVQNQALKDRKLFLKALFETLPDTNFVRMAPYQPYSGEAVEELIEGGWEGAVVKDPESHYVGGRRSSWLKLKAVSTMDMVVMGGIEGKGEKTGKLAVLQVGQYVEDELVWRANCWGKIDLDLADELDRKWKEGSLEGMVVELSHLGVAHTGKFRAPIVERIRLDKTPKECVWTEDDGTWYKLG